MFSLFGLVKNILQFEISKRNNKARIKPKVLFLIK